MKREEMEQMVEEYPSDEFENFVERRADKADTSSEEVILIMMLNSLGWLRKNTNVEGVYNRDAEIMMGELTKLKDLEQAMEATHRLTLHFKKGEL